MTQSRDVVGSNLIGQWKELGLESELKYAFTRQWYGTGLKRYEADNHNLFEETIYKNIPDYESYIMNHSLM